MTEPDFQWIRPKGSGAVAAAAMFTLIWNAFAWHAAFSVTHDLTAALEQGKYGVLVFFIFPAIGLALIVWCVRTALHQLRYGKSRLRLDPNPGAIGGQAGGEIHLSRSLPAESNVTVTLQCLHSRERRKSKGGRKVESQVKWQGATAGRLEPSPTGGVIRFLFDVPAGLPGSESPGREWHHWQLNVHAKVPGVDLGLDFELPMMAAKRRSAIKMPAQARERQRARSEQLVQLLNPDQQGDTLFFDLPYGRGRSSAVMLTLAGLSFVAIGLMVLQQDNGAAANLMGGIFALAGAFMLGAALYLPFNRLQVAIDPQSVHVRRHWMGCQVSRRQLALADIRGVESEERRSAGGGKSLVPYFRVVLVTTAGKRIPVAEDLPGQGLADEAVQFLLQQTPLRAIAQDADTGES